MITIHQKGYKRRKLRIRKKIKGTSTCPRVSVFKSNRYLYAQIINDEAACTLASVSEKELSDQDKKRSKKEKAKILGELLAEKAKKMKIKEVVYDRNRYQYHGIVKIFAQSLRDKGIKF
jgi:large subunit ribosomal protein L18